MIFVLPLELVRLILLFLRDASRHSLSSVVLVNKAFYDLTRPLLYHRFSLTFKEADSVSFKAAGSFMSVSASNRIARLLTDDSLEFALHSIRELVLSYISLSIKLRTKVWSSVSTLISRLHNLREMVFACPVQLPIVLLDTLHQHHPSAHLHVSNWTRRRRDIRVGDPAEEALARSPCLRSISATLPAFPRVDLTKAALARIVGLARNIRSVHVTRGPIGCCGTMLTLGDCALQQQETERFLQTNAPPNPVKEVTWPSLEDVFDLSNIFDLSAIESLSVTADWDFTWRQSPLHMGHTFCSLKHLHLQAVPFDDIPTLDSLVASCNPLESLSLIDYHSNVKLETIIMHHASSLSSLGLHEREWDTQRPTLSPSQLRELLDAIPNLQALEIDVNRTQTRCQEAEVYDVLAPFPNLAFITLHYDLGWHVRADHPYQRTALENEVYPSVSHDFVRKVWTQIRGPNLKQLTIYVGEHNRQVAGRPSPWVSAEQEERQKILVVPDERDDVMDAAQMSLECR